MLAVGSKFNAIQWRPWTDSGLIRRCRRKHFFFWEDWVSFLCFYKLLKAWYCTSLRWDSVKTFDFRYYWFVQVTVGCVPVLSKFSLLCRDGWSWLSSRWTRSSNGYARSCFLWSRHQATSWRVLVLVAFVDALSLLWRDASLSNPRAEWVLRIKLLYWLSILDSWRLHDLKALSFEVRNKLLLLSMLGTFWC